jgi:DNA-binding MarR family transcriptional regulator
MRETSSDSSEAPIDMGKLPDLVGYALRRAQVAVFADFHAQFDAENIRPGQLGVLLVIQRNPGLRQTQVSEALGLRRTNFVPLFDGLEARGLAERRKVDGDRRAFALHLTAKGETLLRRLETRLAAHEAKFVSRIGDDGKRQLLELLRRLTEAGEG